MGDSLFGARNLKQGEGWIQELQTLVDVMADQLVGHVKTTAEAAGMPWGAEKISNTEALERIKRYNDPAMMERLDRLSDKTLIAAAIDAIRRQKQAMKDGLLDARDAQLDGEDGTFIPATVQPGFVAGVQSSAPPPPQAGREAVNLAIPEPMPTSLPAQMALPGLS